MQGSVVRGPSALISQAHRAKQLRRVLPTKASWKPATKAAAGGREAVGEGAALAGEEAAAAALSVSRRGLMSNGVATAGALAAALAPWELGLGVPAAEAGTLGEPRNVIITGANSGIGLDAAKKLAAQGNTVTLACRTLAKAQAAKEQIESELGGQVVGRLIPAECDLADLASVRAFAASVTAAESPAIDVLVCNAGVQYSGDNNIRRTKDGFEVTVGINHLGHFLLTNLLVGSLEKEHGRIVITASEVHDPASPGGSVGPGAGLGDLSGLAGSAEFGMVDGSAYNADKAYKDSKLCNILFARELQRRLAAEGSAVTVNAFGPGLITRTGFFRNQQPLFVKVFDFFTNDVFHVAETVSGGGDCLVYMVNNPMLEGRGGLYFSNDLAPLGKHAFNEQPPSAEAQSEAEAAKLWDYSAKLVGLA